MVRIVNILVNRYAPIENRTDKHGAVKNLTKKGNGLELGSYLFNQVEIGFVIVVIADGTDAAFILKDESLCTFGSIEHSQGLCRSTNDHSAVCEFPHRLTTTILWSYLSIEQAAQRSASAAARAQRSAVRCTPVLGAICSLTSKNSSMNNLF